MKKKKCLKDSLLTAGILLCAALLCLLLRALDGDENGAQLIFVLAVLLISRLTSGYFYGVFASIVSVLGVNYMFTYPYFVFNVTLSGYLLTFLTMLTVALIVSLLTTKTKRQEAEKLEAEREKMRANLLRAVSHDLRTPLTSIVGSTGAILDGMLPQEKQRELIQGANEDAQWLLRMIENMLAVTRMEGDAAITTRAEIVEDVLAEAVIQFKKHFPDIAVDLNLGDDVLLAGMDIVLIEQVVLNLLENAVYHGKNTKDIQITLTHDGQFVYVSVSDDGGGIEKSVLPRLFETQLCAQRNNRSDVRRHMGIGLNVCKSIIKAHGGDMTAKNTEKGACFTFSLPEKENEYAQSADY